MENSRIRVDERDLLLSIVVRNQGKVGAVKLEEDFVLWCVLCPVRTRDALSIVGVERSSKRDPVVDHDAAEETRRSGSVARGAVYERNFRSVGYPYSWVAIRLRLIEKIAKRFHSCATSGLDPAPALSLECDITIDGSCAFEVGRKPERLIARVEWRSKSRYVGIQLQ